MAASIAVGDPITYAYGERTVHASVARRDYHEYDEGLVGYFMPRPIHPESAIPVQQYDDYEGITWERGWTDGIALLAAHALAMSR